MQARDVNNAMGHDGRFSFYVLKINVKIPLIVFLVAQSQWFLETQLFEIDK